MLMLLVNQEFRIKILGNSFEIKCPNVEDVIKILNFRIQSFYDRRGFINSLYLLDNYQ